MKGGELNPPVYGVIEWLTRDGYIAGAGPNNNPYRYYKITQQGRKLLTELRSD